MQTARWWRSRAPALRRANLSLPRLHDVGAQLMHDIDEVRRVGDLQIARSLKVDHALGEYASRPGGYHENAVREEHRLAQVVGHQHDGDLACRMQVADHAPQLLARKGIERAERLVEH